MASKAETFKANIDIILEEVSYRRVDGTPGKQHTGHYTCEQLSFEQQGASGSYLFRIERYNEPASLFSVKLVYRVFVNWDVAPKEKEFNKLLDRIRTLLAIRASHSIASLTDETYKIPIITPPVFSEDVGSIAP